MQAQTTSYGYDSSNRATTETVDLGNGASAVTTTSYDQRGQVIAITGPLGNVSGADPAAHTTNYGYDELGRQTITTLPPVSTEQDGAAPVLGRPQAINGFNSFDELVESKDPGNIATASYDAQGNVVSRALPTYTPPGSSTAITPTSSATYDGDGRMLTSVDTRGYTTRYSYDRLGSLIALDEPNATDADRAVTRYTYTHTGQVLSVTDPSGAVVQRTYDDLDRPVTTTQVERYPATQNLTSSYSYDDNGNARTVTSPSGAVTSSSYDALGQLTAVTDPNGVATQYGYDGMGNQTRITDGLGRSTKSV